jgi:hypothetical protein
MTTPTDHDDETRASEEVVDVEIYEGEPDFEESPTAQPSAPNEEASDA